MAFCFSVAFHAAVVGFCPAPSQDNPGDRGNRQDIVVLGVIEFTPVEQKPMEIFKAVDVAKKSEDSPKPSQPEPANDFEPLPEEKIAMVQPEKPTPSYERPAKQDEPPQHETLPPTENVIPGRQALPQGQIQDIRSLYLSGIMRKLEKTKQYPLYAFRHGIEGMAEVEFTIHSDGHATAVTIRKSSRHLVLNAAAEEIVRRASPFDPIPVELGEEEMTIRVPVAFRIEEAETR
ncbi:MAG: energy transducer TonB [Kiritimatiellae bacterium]|nr:energy transducer TonB [Kiritimatiellia bacterium]